MRLMVLLYYEQKIGGGIATLLSHDTLSSFRLPYDHLHSSEADPGFVIGGGTCTKCARKFCDHAPKLLTTPLKLPFNASRHVVNRPSSVVYELKSTKSVRFVDNSSLQ